MAWVPLQGSGLHFTFASNSSAAVEMIDSVVTAVELDRPSWLIDAFDDAGSQPLRLRITCLEYFAAGAVSGAFVWYDGESEHSQPNLAVPGDPGGAGFEPEQFIALVGAENPIYYYAPPLEYGSETHRFLVEVEVDDVGPPPQPDRWNCDCACDYPFKTLAQLRREMMIGLGFAMQANNPPPGMTDFIDFHLNQAQDLVLADLEEAGHVRYFSWQLSAGQRFYGFEDQDTGACAKLVRALKIHEAYIEDSSGKVITRLERGIPALLYNGGIQNSTPTRYETRQCIELWPAPGASDARLVVRGLFKSVELADPDDRSTVDPRALILRALAFAKAAKGQPDGQNYMGQYGAYLASLNEDSFNDERFIPGRGLRDPRYCERLTHVMEPRIYGDGSTS